MTAISSESGHERVDIYPVITCTSSVGKVRELFGWPTTVPAIPGRNKAGSPAPTNASQSQPPDHSIQSYFFKACRCHMF